MAPLMFSFRFLFFLSPVLFLMISTQSQSPYCYNDKGNYTTNSTYKTNLNTLLSSLSSPSNNGNGYGFYNLSYGENPDQVYAIGLCRGDVTVDFCRGCLSNATQQITQGCPNQKEAFGVIEQCTLRYSNRSIYGAMETFPPLMWYNAQNVPSDVDGFSQELNTLLEDLRGQAAGNGSLRKFAVGTATFPNFQNVYGLAQCTPDLTEQVCSDCLGSSLADIPKIFEGKQGALISKPSCNVRYEVNTTTIRPLPSSPSPLSSPPPPSASTGGSKSDKSRTVIIIVVPIVVSVVLIVMFFCICLLRVRRTKKKLETAKLIPGKNATLVLHILDTITEEVLYSKAFTSDGFVEKITQVC
ncbi:PREDICTED: cysteine-rich receptor-like protein kinase 10 [Prunus mume]|uniref:Cysteine-rich receptor-like protein kinase 10 n=1 Tax=Prunus mume TaxID=102107 RepID=A0ABM0P4F1_PRUMU|nr:PREDICTED: cysteine-rich receptor-like protein kinase 10 [Prunus mume]